MNEGTWAGNMYVLGRDSEKAVYLRCACLEEFIYAPGSSTNRCTLNGRAHAVCPKCRTLWDTSIEPRITTPMRYFMIYLRLDEGGKAGIEKAEFSVAGVGEARTPSEFMLKCLADFSGTDYRGVMITEIKEIDYREVRDKVNEAKASLAAAVLFRLLGGRE